MQASIGLRTETKEALSRLKPPGMTWDRFLLALQRAVDASELEHVLSAEWDALEAEQTEKALTRYEAVRKDPALLVSPTELKRRIRVRRLAAEVTTLAAAVEEGDQDIAWGARLEQLHEQVQALRSMSAGS